MKKHVYDSKLRFAKAYWVTFIIITRYLKFRLYSQIFREEKWEKYLEKMHQKNAILIKASILELRGLFIKVGQMVSIMTNFLPSAYTKEFEGLQDSVPPYPFEAIEDRFQKDFKKKSLDLFASIENQPIASASLGQVHVAYLENGEKLAVKIQYPNIERIVKADLKILKRIYKLLGLFFPNYGYEQIHEEVKEIVDQELNFVQEGQNLEAMAKNFIDDSRFAFPKIYWAHSSKHILSMEYMEGAKISKHGFLEENNIDAEEVAKDLLHAFCKQIFVDGLYHADPHPGNFLIRKHPDSESSHPHQIVFMDFGATAKISEKMRLGIRKFFEGIIHRNNNTIAQALKDMGFVSKGRDEELFNRIVEFFYEKIKNIQYEDLRNFELNLNQIRHLDDLIELDQLDLSLKELMDSFTIPKDWALLERALVVLYGLTSHLAPKMNPLEIILPYAENFVLGERSFREVVTEMVKEIGLSYIKLPNLLENNMRKLQNGEITVRVKSDQKERKVLIKAINRLTYLLAAGFSFMAHYNINAEHQFMCQLSQISAYLFLALFVWNFVKRK